MDQDQIAAFKAHYGRLADYDLADLQGRATTLTEEAQVALAEVLATRNVDVAKIRAEEAQEAAVVQAKEKARHEAWERRDRAMFKWGAIIAAPLILIGVLTRPDRAYEALISSLVQVAGIALIVWVVQVIRKRRAGRPSQN